MSRTCTSYLGIIKCAIAFTIFLATFTVTVTLKFCCWLSLFVSVYFYWYLHTYKILLPVKTNNFLYLYRYYSNYKFVLPVAVILFLFNWRTGKTKTPILLYIMQHPRQFLIFGINLNEFSVSQMQHLHVELSINFRISNFKNYRHCKF